MGSEPRVLAHSLTKVGLLSVAVVAEIRACRGQVGLLRLLARVRLSERRARDERDQRESSENRFRDTVPFQRTIVREFLQQRGGRRPVPCSNQANRLARAADELYFWVCGTTERWARSYFGFGRCETVKEGIISSVVAATLILAVVRPAQRPAVMSNQLKARATNPDSSPNRQSRLPVASKSRREAALRIAGGAWSEAPAITVRCIAGGRRLSEGRASKQCDQGEGSEERFHDASPCFRTTIIRGVLQQRGADGPCSAVAREIGSLQSSDELYFWFCRITQRSTHSYFGLSCREKSMAPHARCRNGPALGFVSAQVR
jgi:hypothetical protein